MMYGKKLRYGFFAGWMKNYGAVDGNFVEDPVVRNNTGLAQAYRFSPIVTYKVENMQIGLEYEHTAAAYGNYKLNMNEYPKNYTNGTVGDTHWVANNRVCVMVKYDF